MAIIFLAAGYVVKSNDLIGEIKAQGFYLVTVIVGELFHGFLILPVVYLLIVRRNPLKFIRGILPAMAMGAATANS